MKNRYIFLIAFSVLSVILGVQIYMAIRQNGMFSYPLDDSYIHMAIAKNISKYGVWGITKYGFTSASSSILYSLILSFFFLIFGVSIWIPLIINWSAATIILYLVIKWAGHYLSGLQSLVFSLIFIFLIPLPVIVIMGMEHTLHLLLCLVFIYITFDKFRDKKISNWIYFISTVLVVGIRYESIFLVGVTALVWLIVQKNSRLFVMLILGIIIPVVAFGIYSKLQGGFFLPNSLLIKGPDASNSIYQFIGATMKKIYNTGLIYALLFLPCIYLFIVPMSKNKPDCRYPVHLIFIIIALTCLAHFILARFGKPYRYGAYLVGMELALIPIIWKEMSFFFRRLSIFSFVMVGCLAVFCLLPVLFRAGATFNNNIAMKNIRDQQVTMALFLNKYFPETTVALNDIGAVSFYNDDIHVFDLVGLANVDVLKMHEGNDPQLLSHFSLRANVKIAIVYPDWIEWLGYNKPGNWELLGEWCLTDNYIAGNPRVGIFAADPTIKDTLLRALRKYSRDVPSNVLQSGLYMEQIER